MDSMASTHDHVTHDEDARWSAVLGHERAADGMFVYAVRSTGNGEKSRISWTARFECRTRRPSCEPSWRKTAEERLAWRC